MPWLASPYLMAVWLRQKHEIFTKNRFCSPLQFHLVLSSTCAIPISSWPQLKEDSNFFLYSVVSPQFGLSQHQYLPFLCSLTSSSRCPTAETFTLSLLISGEGGVVILLWQPKIILQRCLGHPESKSQWAAQWDLLPFGTLSMDGA